MTKLASLLLMLALVPQVAPSSAQNVDAIVEKHLAAMGGREVLGKLTSRKSTGTVTVTTPGGPLSGPIEILLKAPNKSHVHMALDLSAIGGPGTMTIDQGFDGTAAYSINSLQGENQVSEKQADNLRNNIFPTPFLEYKQRGTKLEMLANEKVAGKDVIVLQITPKTGSPARMFLDAETYLPVRLVSTINVPQAGGDIEQTTDLSDYRPVDGVKVPFRVATTNPVQTVNISLDKVEHNIALDDAMFKK